MHAREKGEQRKGKRATKQRTKQGVASSRARDARREGGTAGTRHIVGTTPHRSTGEGSTRGTRGKRHHAHHAPRTDTTHTAQSGDREHLTSDAPHNGGRHPPRRHPSADPTASNAGPQGRTLRGRCWVPTPAPTAPGTHGSRNARWPPVPEDGRPGEGQRLTPGAPHNSGKPPPMGTAPHHPRGTQPPQGMQAKGTVLSPHTHTPAPIARGWRTPTAHPVGGQSEEGQRLTSDAPHNGGRHPRRGLCSATPTASKAGPQGRTLWGRCWVPTPAPTAPGTHESQNPGRPLQRTGGLGRDSA